MADNPPRDFEAMLADVTAHLQQQMAANRAPPRVPAPPASQQQPSAPLNRLFTIPGNAAIGEGNRVYPSREAWLAEGNKELEVPSPYTPGNIVHGLLAGAEGVVGATGMPAGLVMRGIMAAPNRLMTAAHEVGNIVAGARELPGKAAGAVSDVMDTIARGFRSGNVTEADRAASAAARKAELADVDRQLADITRRQQQRAQDRMDWVSDYVRGQPLPQGLARHEYEAMLQDFDRLAFQNRGNGGRWLSQDATRAEIEAARDAAPRERRSLAPRERREAPASANQSNMNRLLQDAPQSSRPSTGAIITGAGAAGALGTAGYLKAVQSGLLPRPEWMNRLQPGQDDLQGGK